MRRIVVGSVRLLHSAAAAGVGDASRRAGLGSGVCKLRAASRWQLPAQDADKHYSLPGFHSAHTSAVEPVDPSPPGETTPHRHHPAPTPAETGGPLAKYGAGLQAGYYRPDPRQKLTIQMLQELYDALQKASASHQLPGQQSQRSRRRPSGLTMVDHVGGEEEASESGREATTSSSSGFSWLTKSLGRAFGGGGKGSSGNGGSKGSAGGEGESSEPPVRGLYMYGGVGVGKTMLMDLFVTTAPTHFKVLRTHFHDFMLEVHAALRRHARSADPLLMVADGIASRARVLALDELFVTDVADAMILNRLFGRLWDRGVVLLATSNRPPDDLYKGGLQRNLFMPFIHRLKVQCRAHDMESTTDYRRLAHHQRGLYFITPRGSASSSSSSSPSSSPSSSHASSSGASATSSSSSLPGGASTSSSSSSDPLMERFLELAGEGAEAPAPARVEVMMGRSLEVPLAAGKVCMFPFQELCGRPVAAADYLALTGGYHTLALRGVPVFGAHNRSEAYRFVTLIDVMYENRTRLLVTADAAPVDLFDNILTQFDAAKNPALAARPDAVVDDNLGFAKDRTISRLTEMQSVEYLLHHAKQHEPALVLALQELQAQQRSAAEAAAVGAVGAAAATAGH
ncbi:hypothetical protein Agub_g10405 [Astrephomene gubernaculifera]|uniref:AFG1-like ATPase n=1 Tax=Astrephomene gubernaculifera TaxID=47775 RepID=A0AAD3DWP6_9CHLO|nr:hypothetical protein Agub_g10405 [Astrephomene gubernaculifera]